MHKKFEINRTKIKGSCQSGRKVATHDCKSDLPLVTLMLSTYLLFTIYILTLNEAVENYKNFDDQEQLVHVDNWWYDKCMKYEFPLTFFWQVISDFIVK